MSKKHMMRRIMPGLLAGVMPLLVASCAVDGFDDESFSSETRNTAMVTPGETEITITPSADGKSQTISWPLVKGASGFEVKVWNVDDETTPEVLVDSLIDGYAVTLSRKEDTMYKMQIHALGNKTLGNSDAENTTVKAFNTFVASLGAIPAGVDLCEFFQSHPVPEQEGIAYYDLEAGAEYTMSGLLEFGACYVGLRTMSAKNHAKVKFTSTDAGFATSAGFVLKNIDFDCSASSAGFISLSKTPAITPIIVNAWSTDYNFYLVKDPINIVGCNISGVNSYFLWDNQVSCWFANDVIVDNCVVHLTTPSDSKAVSGAVFWTNKGAGYFRNLTVSNSTWYSTGEGVIKYFVQYGGLGQQQAEAGFGWANNTITYENCTFYNVCSSGQWGNYNGTAGKATSYWNMKRCIFYNCSTSGVARRFLHGKANQATATFEWNTYMKTDGTFDDPGSYDTSGTDVKEDPDFADPANANFTVSNPTHIEHQMGDPRWLPGAE